MDDALKTKGIIIRCWDLVVVCFSLSKFLATCLRSVLSH